MNIHLVTELWFDFAIFRYFECHGADDPESLFVTTMAYTWNYFCINLASRLEGLTKYYGASIIISSAVLEKIKELSQYSIRYLDRVRVKGRKQPIEIYEVMNADDPSIRDKKLKTNSEFRKGINFYLVGKMKLAEEIFSAFDNDLYFWSILCFKTGITTTTIITTVTTTTTATITTTITTATTTITTTATTTTSTTTAASTTTITTVTIITTTTITTATTTTAASTTTTSCLLSIHSTLSW